MHGFAPALGYLALLAYLPVVYATGKSASGGKWRNLTFLRLVAKDFLRTFPMVALVWAPVFVFPAAAKWYTLGIHLVFAPLVIFEVGHVKYFGARVGLNTFYSLFVTNTREFRDYARQSVTLYNWCVLFGAYLLPVPLLVRYIPTAAFDAEWMRAVFAAASFVAWLPFLCNLTKKGSRFKIGYVLNPYSNLAYHWFEFKRSYGELKKSIAAHAAPPFEKIMSSVAAEMPETYVICIGESSNAQHHSYCGYPRRTNEFTDALGDEIRRVPGVRTTYAQTLPSLEKVLTFADEAHPALLWTKGSIIDYFREAGFKTFWLSNQYALDDTAITALAGHADVMKCFNYGDMKRFEKSGLDGDMLPEVEKTLSDPAPKKVVFLHLIGSHSAYVSRYPAEFAHFKGSVPGKEGLGSLQAEMVNAYDDSIRYTDWVVSRLAAALKKVSGLSWLLYFSDHGEDVYDSTDKKVLGHSQLANEPMTSVPFMVWTNANYDCRRPDVKSRSARSGYNLEDVIHTILDLASLSNDDFCPERSILLPSVAVPR